MRSRYFGTDGFRGEANELLTVEHSFRVGRYLGWHYSEDGTREARIVIGKDTRRSSYMFEAALVAGIVSSGADAYLLHVTTTPSVAYVVRSDNFDCGIMISASHNPYYDNGIKLFNHGGEKMEEGVIAQIEAYLDRKTELAYAKREKIGRSVDFVAGRNRYIGYLISLGIYSFKGWKIGLDCANGSGWHIARSVFHALGAATFTLGVEPNGVNVNEECGSTHIEGLQRLVREKNLDVGFAFDGDGDRCLCVDEKGEVVDGDKILYVCAQHMQERGELFDNRIVTGVMSNSGLYRALDKLGIACEKAAVGDRFVYEKMQELSCPLGGEQSGHIIFSKYACTGDGVLTALKIMEAMIEKKSKLSALTADMVPFPQVLVNVKTADKEGVMKKEKVLSVIRATEALLDKRGRILVRPSGTEPLVRVMAEGETENLCRRCAERIVAAIEETEREK